MPIEPIETPAIIEELMSLGKLRENTTRMIEELISPRHTIGPEELQFLEVPFLKPTCKNPRERSR